MQIISDNSISIILVALLDAKIKFAHNTTLTAQIMDAVREVQTYSAVTQVQKEGR